MSVCAVASPFSPNGRHCCIASSKSPREYASAPALNGETAKSYLKNRMPNTTPNRTSASIPPTKTVLVRCFTVRPHLGKTDAASVDAVPLDRYCARSEEYASRETEAKAACVRAGCH